MKGLGLIALLCCFASCKDEAIVTDLRGTGDEVFDRIYHFEYKSHEYILFRTGLGNNAVAGIVHDPDCKCKEETK